MKTQKNNSISLFFLGLTLLTTIAFVQTAYGKKLFFSKEATEALFKFSTTMEMESIVDLRDWEGNPQKTQLIQMTIEAQVKHMFGSLAHPGLGQSKAAPKTDHRIEILKVEELHSGLYEVEYGYSGTLLVQQLNTEDSLPESLSFFLPNNPSQIYGRGMVGGSNPCTDPHYQSEGDFWYFWNPFQTLCPLIEGEDFHSVTARVVRKQNTPMTYPDYPRLMQDGVLPGFIIFGMNHQDVLRDPYKAAKADPVNYLNAVNYVSMADWFEKMQYQKTRVSFSKTFLGAENPAYDALVSLEVFEKETTKGLMQFFMFYGPTGVNESQSPLFHQFFLSGLQYASFVIYNGHSGLGGNLNLDYFDQIYQKARPALEQYQIYYFNSCSSYPYYNDMYFRRKQTAQDPKGTQNLDIITNGLATYFSVIDDTSKIFVTMIDLWASGQEIMSYQQFSWYADSGNLLGVNGDEDNPTSPEQVK